MSEHVDVLIVGAGLSGIGAAHHIQAAFPDKTYAILEARDATNASWTLKADLVSEFVCRLLGYMDSRGYDTCVPVNDDPGVTEQPLLDFSAGYVLRSIDQFPSAGSRAPWRLGMSYAHDVVRLRYGKINDGSMRFSREDDDMSQISSPGGTGRGSRRAAPVPTCPRRTGWRARARS